MIYDDELVQIIAWLHVTERISVMEVEMGIWRLDGNRPQRNVSRRARFLLRRRWRTTSSETRPCSGTECS